MNKIEIFFDKIKRKIRYKIVMLARKQSFYPLLYRSYRHSILSTYHNREISTPLYFSSVPNRGAGIGHQMANWVAGYWFAKQFNLEFAHTEFSTPEWESFLGFGEDEINVRDLVKKKYKKVRLPLFDEKDEQELGMIRKIILSYHDRKIVFLTEQDQFYRDQFGVMNDLKHKFYAAKARMNDQLVYLNHNVNIAVHVRRGDILIGQDKNPNLQKRLLDNSYFVKVLTQVLDNFHSDKSVAIYIFSQGDRADFHEFDRFENVHFCFDMTAADSFLHMVYADILISSKSSFSYKPALLSNGIKVCPENFWHGYPMGKDWILVDDDGVFDTSKLNFYSESF